MLIKAFTSPPSPLACGRLFGRNFDVVLALCTYVLQALQAEQRRNQHNKKMKDSPKQCMRPTLRSTTFAVSVPLSLGPCLCGFVRGRCIRRRNHSSSIVSSCSFPGSSWVLESLLVCLHQSVCHFCCVRTSRLQTRSSGMR